MIVGVIGPATVEIAKLVGVGPAVAAQVEDRLAGAVAGELGLGAVGVEDPQLGDELRVLAAREQQDPVGADPEVRVAEPLDPRLGSAPREARPPRGSGSRCPAPATSRISRQPSHSPTAEDRYASAIGCGDLGVAEVGAVDRRQVGDFAHPGELAAGVVARAASSSSRRRRRAARRSRAPCGRCGRGRARRRGAPPRAAAGGDDRLDPGVDPLVEPRAVHVEAEDRGRVAGLAPTTAPTPPFGRDLAQREVGERGAQVEAGAADDDRRRPAASAASTSRVGERHVVADREVGSVTGTKPSSRCSSRSCSAARRGAGQHVEPLVDLQRVAVDRDRILAPLAQQLAPARSRRRSCRPRSARRSRGPSRKPARAAAPRRPLSVCEVAASISTVDQLPGLGDPFEVDRLVVAGAAAQPGRVGAARCPRPGPPSSARRSAARARRRARWTTSTSRSIRSTLTGCGSWPSIVAASVSRRGREDEGEGAVVADLLDHLQRLARSRPRSRPGSRR